MAPGSYRGASTIAVAAGRTGEAAASAPARAGAARCSRVSSRYAGATGSTRSTAPRRLAHVVPQPGPADGAASRHLDDGLLPRPRRAPPDDSCPMPCPGHARTAPPSRPDLRWQPRHRLNDTSLPWLRTQEGVEVFRFPASRPVPGQAPGRRVPDRASTPPASRSTRTPGRSLRPRWRCRRRRRSGSGRWSRATNRRPRPPRCSSRPRRSTRAWTRTRHGGPGSSPGPAPCGRSRSSW